MAEHVEHALDPVPDRLLVPSDAAAEFGVDGRDTVFGGRARELSVRPLDVEDVATAEGLRQL